MGESWKNVGLSESCLIGSLEIGWWWRGNVHEMFESPVLSEGMAECVGNWMVQYTRHCSRDGAGQLDLNDCCCL